MDKSFLKRLADSNLSIIPVSADKRPLGQWKAYQTEARTKEDIDKLKSPLYGLVTGFSGVEVIDVDLKVFSTLQEQNDFWNELLSFLKDNIDDFDKKFVIYKTKNQGYHILYRCDTIVGNTKIAVLEGHKEAVIESRGIGGMVVLYENQISKLSYSEIQTISSRDRDIAWGIAKTYNYINHEEIEVPKIIKKTYDESIITPWDDYNQNVSIFEIISSELKIVRTLNDRYILQRIGSDNPMSGSVFKSNGCMYLFTTGTSFEHEKLYTPFTAYTRIFHNDDYTASARELYNKGYGTRLVHKKIEKVEPEKREAPKINKDDLVFPIEIFPEPIQSYILECKETLDFLGNFVA